MKQLNKIRRKNEMALGNQYVWALSMALIICISQNNVLGAQEHPAMSDSAAANAQLAAMIAAHFKEHRSPFAGARIEFKEPLPHQRRAIVDEPISALPDTPVGRLQAELRVKLQELRDSAVDYPRMTPDKIQEEYQLMAEYSEKIKDVQKPGEAVASIDEH